MCGLISAVIKVLLSSVLIAARSLCHLSLHDEAVLRRVEIAIEDAEENFDEVRIAIAHLDIASLELLAVAHEDDGAVFYGLKRR
jgi:hypothetical protein